MVYLFTSNEAREFTGELDSVVTGPQIHFGEPEQFVDNFLSTCLFGLPLRSRFWFRSAPLTLALFASRSTASRRGIGSHHMYSLRFVARPD